MHHIITTKHKPYDTFLYFYKYVLNDMGISFKRGKENLNT